MQLKLRSLRIAAGSWEVEGLVILDKEAERKVLEMLLEIVPFAGMDVRVEMHSA